MMQHLRPQWYRHSRLKRMVPEKYSPCADSFAIRFLNKPDVQKAMHVQGSTSWAPCSGGVRYSRSSVNSNMVPVIKGLIEHGGLRIMIMSGTEDSVCAHLGDQRWIWDTGYKTTQPWGPYKLDGQVAGF